MNRMRLVNRGLFAGDFVITSDKQSFSIGNYIRIESRGEFVPTGEYAKTPRGDVPVTEMPVTIHESCHNEPIDAMLYGYGNATMHRWNSVLWKNFATVRVVKITIHGHEWYAPEARKPLEV